MKNIVFHIFVLTACALIFVACGSRVSDQNRNGSQVGNSASANSANISNSSNNLNTGSTANTAASNSNSDPVVTNEEVAAGLLQIEDAWNQAYVEKNEAWFQQNLADDYSEVGDSGKSTNDKAGAISEMKSDKSTEIVAEISETKVRVEGNSAIVTGINHVRLKDASGKPVEYKHRFTDTYIKRNGRWLIWADQATRIP